MRRRQVGSIVLMAMTCAITVGRCDTRTADRELVARWVTGLQFTDPMLPSYGAVKIHPTAAAIARDGKPYCMRSNIGHIVIVHIIGYIG